MSADKIKPVSPFLKARRAGVPIVAIETADPSATIRKCQNDLNGKHAVTPLIQYDIVRGLQAVSGSKPGQVILSQAFSEDARYPFTGDPTACLDCACTKAGEKKLQVIPEGGNADEPVAAILFIIHANCFMEDTGFMQACWNARLAFEPRGITLVLLGPVIKLRPELKNDVILISEPLPDHAELGEILDDISKAADLKPGQIADRDRVVDTMRGTSAFGARQILAMSINKEGIDMDQLWDRKRKMIEQCPGLSVWRGGTTFADIGGLGEIKDYLTRLLTSGTTPVQAIGYWDEIEKALAGAGGDLSGTSSDQLMVILKIMADYQIPGLIMVGPGGTGKSEIAKAAGNAAGCPTIAFDTGAMKDSLVGSSEARIRQAMEVFKAVSLGTDKDGNAQCQGFWIATCNKIGAMPPELLRRYKMGIYYVDLPTTEEQSKIWPIWIKRFDLDKRQALPDSRNWTGAEVAACCEIAYRAGYTLKEAALRIVPISKSNPESINALRTLATNRFLSASRPGVYTYEPEAQDQSTGRKISRE